MVVKKERRGPRYGSGYIRLTIAVINRHGLFSIHMPAYYDSVLKGVSTIMISYSSVNGVRMHGDHELVTNFLKNTVKFRGFVISDWQGIDRITDPPHANYTFSILKSVEAGLDMIMVPYNYTEFIDGLTYLVKNNFIPMTRIDDAVRRILRVKFVMGLFENPLADLAMAKYLGIQEHRDLAREAVRKSLVLLKNGKSGDPPLLPLPKKSTKILVSGSHADNIGNQCGGWTIEWHGQSGNITIGTTILSAIKNTVDPQTEVIYQENPTPEFIKSNNFSYAIVVTGEYPYSETVGDSLNLTVPEPGPTTITNVCGTLKCVVVLISGRPVVIEPYVSTMDALVAAWLPGSEGQGVADVLFGDYGFTGKLARTWFKTVDQLPMNVGDPHYDPLYPFGYGLTTQPNSKSPQRFSYGGGDIESGMQSGELNLVEFFRKVQGIEHEFEKLNKLLKKLQDAHEESRSVTKAAAMKAIKKRMENDVDEVGRIARFIKAKIEELDKENLANRQKPGCGQGTGVDRSRTSTTLSLKKKFKEKVTGFQSLRESIHQEYREVVERRVFTVTGTRADEETIDQLIETGNSEQIYQKAIQEQGRGQVIDTLAEIQERHDAVIEVERKLLDLQQIFTDFAILVDSQGEILDNIEAQVSSAVDHVESGNKTLEKVKKLQKKSRKWICISIMILLLVIAIALVVVLKGTKLLDSL
uniref:t-SNARE coiled-coil homology domain-containing protein n=1 Tax=Lactuca sativa TaxID=4236 RepID=A0A9R1VBE9_LACSA|nr:hypothetical protein LSAT_V11C600311590 [Lactuca sativa]